MDLGNFVSLWNTARNRTVLVAPIIRALVAQQPDVFTQMDVDAITAFAENDPAWSTQQVYVTYETGPSGKFLRVNCATERISLRRFRMGTEFVNAALGRKPTTTALQTSGLQSEVALVAEPMPQRSKRSIELAAQLGNSNTRNPESFTPLRPKRRISRLLVAVLLVSIVFFLVGSILYTRIGSFTKISPSALTQSAISTPSPTPTTKASPQLTAELLQKHFEAHLEEWVTEPGQYLSAIAQALGEESYDSIAQRNGVSPPAYIINIGQHLHVIVGYDQTLPQLNGTYVIQLEGTVLVTSDTTTLSLPLKAQPTYFTDSYRIQSQQLRDKTPTTPVTSFIVYQIQGLVTQHPCKLQATALSAQLAVTLAQQCNG